MNRCSSILNQYLTDENDLGIIENLWIFLVSFVMDFQLFNYRSYADSIRKIRKRFSMIKSSNIGFIFLSL